MRRILVIAALLALTACSSSTSRLAKVSPPAKLAVFTATVRVHPIWYTQVDEGVRFEYTRLNPLIADGVAYAAAGKGLVEAFDANTGSRLWKTEAGTEVTGGPGDGGDTVLIGGDAVVVALNKKNGAVRWRAQLSSEVMGTPKRAGGRIIVRTIDGNVFGLDPSSGHEVWRYHQDVPLLSLHGASDPQLAGGMVLVGFANGKLVALSPADGRQLWEAQVAVARGRTELERMVDIDAQVDVDSGIVYAASYQGRLSAFALNDGRLLWSREFSSYSGLAAADGVLYATDADGNLWAFSQRDGSALWKQDGLHGRRPTAPAVQGANLVVADGDGYLHWVKREDGSFVGRVRVQTPLEWFPLKNPEDQPNGFKEDRAVLAAPVVAADYVYDMDKRGALNAFQVSPLKVAAAAEVPVREEGKKKPWWKWPWW